MRDPDGTVPVRDFDLHATWKLNDERTRVRLDLPPIPLAGLPEPLKVSMDFDAEQVDEMIGHLLHLRAKMLQPPRRN